jgi:hypothetical protein
VTWLSRDYLADGWVADGWLLKQTITPNPGGWLNKGYTSKRWISARWIRFPLDAAGSATTQLNVPGLALVALSGNAKQNHRINATMPGLPLATFAATITIGTAHPTAVTQLNLPGLAFGKFDAVANAGHHTTQTNVPGLALGTFQATVQGGLAQIGNITFFINVLSTFSAQKNVSALNVPGIALTPIPAAIALGNSVNVAGDITHLALGVFPVTAKANSKTGAISTLPVPLAAHPARITVGRAIISSNVLPVPLSAFHASVVAVSNSANAHVTATLTNLPLGVRNPTVGTLNPTTLWQMLSQRPFAISRRRIS